MIEFKCKKCAYYRRLMIGKDGAGYNPAPCCHKYEDTGEHPTIWTQECYKPRKKMPKTAGGTK